MRGLETGPIEGEGAWGAATAFSLEASRALTAASSQLGRISSSPPAGAGAGWGRGAGAGGRGAAWWLTGWGRGATPRALPGAGCGRAGAARVPNIMPHDPQTTVEPICCSWI